MLEISVPHTELWDEKKEEFVSVRAQTLQLEHSLISISKWEAKWHKSFVNTRNKSYDETLYYIQCMTMNSHVQSEVYQCLTEKNIAEINTYIDEPMSACYFQEDSSKKPNRDTVTAELIYFWMLQFGIPFECQKWHLNRLIALIRVCQMKSEKPKKMSRSELMNKNRALNAARKSKYHTKG